MKKNISKILGFGLIVGALFFTTSCNKKQDWNCVCEINGNKNTTLIKDKTRKEAKADCNNSGSFLGIDYECKISLF